MPVTLLSNTQYAKTRIIDLNTQYTMTANQPFQVVDVDAINNFIYNILFTSKNEEVFEPDFGSGIALDVFDNIVGNQAIELIHEAYFSIQKWLPWCTVNRAASSVAKNNLTGNVSFRIVYSIANLPGEYVHNLTISTQQ